MNQLIKYIYRQKWNIRNIQENFLSNLKNEELSSQRAKKFAQELKLQEKNFKCLFGTEPYGYLLITKCIEGSM